MPIDFERPPMWRRYLRLWGSDAAGDVDTELRFHLESRVAELVAEGWDEETARRAARERFGDLESIRLRCRKLSEERERSMRRSEWFNEIAQDLRYGARTLARSPGFSVVAVLSLAVGIGATTAIFGLLHKVLLERLAVAHPEQLVQVLREIPEMGGRFPEGLTPAQYDAIRDLPGVTFTTFNGTGGALSVAAERTDYAITAVEGSFFSVVDVRPLLGRLVNAEDDRNAATVVVISEDLWQHYFTGDRNALGKVLRINDVPFTVIGVTPASFRGVHAFGQFHAAIPISTISRVRPRVARDRGQERRLVIGRLHDGAREATLEPMLQARLASCCTAAGTPQSAQSNVPAEAASGGKGMPAAAGKVATAPVDNGAPAAGKGAAASTDKAATAPTPKAAPAAASVQQGPPWVLDDMSRGMNGKFDVRAQYRGFLYGLMGGVVVLLLVACANVGTLLLARAETRRRELAVRYSLGAVRLRLLRQLFTESLQLALIGAVLGYMLSRWGLGLLAARMEPGTLTDLMTQKPSNAVLGFTTLVTVLATILFGILPAQRATRIDVVAQLKEGGQRSGRRTGLIDRGLIVVQVALALLLITSSGLLMQTLHNLRNIDPGFEASNLLLVRADFGQNRPTWEATTDDDVALARVQRLPGVRAAAIAATSPIFGGSIWLSTVEVTGYIAAPDEDTNTRFNMVTHGYFDAAGIALRAGRVFNDADRAGTETVAVVSETFARRFASGRSPVGLMVGNREITARIVGVVEDVRYENMRTIERPMLYLSSLQPGGGMSEPLVLMIRTAGEPGALAELVQRELRASGARLSIRQVETMNEVIDRSLARERIAAILGTLFGVVALALAALGLYGVIAYQVAGRTMEIGTRMALGAHRSGVLWLVLRQSVGLLLIGFAIGVPLALGATRALASQLFGVRAFDPVTLGIALVVLFATGLLASLLPARRATRVDPLTALRAS